jgi:hypothetical protein
MKKLIYIAGCFLGSLLLSSAAEAGGVALSARASTLGLGLELTAGLADKVNVRLGGNTFSFGRTFTEDSDEFDLDLKLRSFTALLDIHPFGGGFRLSGGFVANNNEASLTGQATDSYDIGDSSYSASDVGALTGIVDTKKGAAYAGIGFGNAVREGRKLGVVFDTGVVFQGSPNVTLRANGPIAGNPGFQADLRQEELSIEDDARQFRYYPVLSFGISYKF